eukprot:GHVS01063102.1.p1 GENE.GHVS01063102.1~~GHVS01063102.1.p1  ORF type:complete len:476 (-),score=93.79 GHVS01063102.1:242-1669(-)
MGEGEDWSSEETDRDECMAASGSSGTTTLHISGGGLRSLSTMARREGKEELRHMARGGMRDERKKEEGQTTWRGDGWRNMSVGMSLPTCDVGSGTFSGTEESDKEQQRRESSDSQRAAENVVAEKGEEEENKLLAFGLAAVYRGYVIADRLQGSLKARDKLVKQDSSPVTLADYSVQSLISLLLRPSSQLLLSEENIEFVSPEMLSAIASQVASVLPGRSELEPKKVLDAFLATTEPTVRTLRRGCGSYWVLDPIDGTKGFMRGDQYAIALAYIKDGELILGILGCPNLPCDWSRPDGPRGSIFYAVKGESAYEVDLSNQTVDLNDQNAAIAAHLVRGARPLRVRADKHRTVRRFFESYDSAHSSHAAARAVAERLGISTQPIRLDSQVKYAMVARGDGDLILRLPRKNYKENVWDHAAGAVIIAEAGGCVSHADGSALEFAGRQQLDNQSGLVVSSEPRLHEDAVKAVRSMRPM